MDAHAVVFSLSVLVSVAGDLAYAVLVGLLFVQGWLVAPAFPPVPPQLSIMVNRRGPLAALALLASAHLLKPWFVAASMSGLTNFRDNLLLIPSILSSTHEGKLWWLGSLAILGLLLTRSIAKKHAGGGRQWFAIGAIVVLAFVKAGSGHAADEGDFTLTEMLQTLHILATAAWAGPILMSGFVALPYLLGNLSPAAVWEYGGRLSKVASYSVGIIVLTGVYTSDKELSGMLSGLWTSAWGRILIAKITLVLIALILGGGNRFLCLRNEATEERSIYLRKMLFCEAMLMLAILCLSGLLGNTAPAMPM
jgi:putative copper resistance protein D